MLNSFHYTLRTTSRTGDFVNAAVVYEVFFDVRQGISYQVELQTPVNRLSRQLQTVWRAKIVNDLNGRRLEYDYLRRIYYQTPQTIQVESALFKLTEDLIKFLRSSQGTAVQDLNIGGKIYQGYRLNTLTIWYDPEQFVPIRRENADRGNLIIDEFVYHSINEPIPNEVFLLPKPEEAVTDFNLFPAPPSLPRFETTGVVEIPQSEVYVKTLLQDIKRHVILNQWEYGPFSTIKLPWLTDMKVTIYRGRSAATHPPLVVIFDVPGQGPASFFVGYDFLGYVVTGFTQDQVNLNNYELLPITASVRLEELVPLYAGPSPEKDYVVANFITSVQSNDTFISAFDMGGKQFDLAVKNFSFHENEGYLILNVYGKEYWDNANMEAMFNYIVTGQMADAHTTPTIIYALNTLKRLGIYREVRMPVYRQVSSGGLP